MPISILAFPVRSSHCSLLIVSCSVWIFKPDWCKLSILLCYVHLDDTAAVCKGTCQWLGSYSSDLLPEALRLNHGGGSTWSHVSFELFIHLFLSLPDCSGIFFMACCSSLCLCSLARYVIFSSPFQCSLLGGSVAMDACCPVCGSSFWSYATLVELCQFAKCFSV